MSSPDAKADADQAPPAEQRWHGLTLTTDGPVAMVRLSRPEALNAMDAAFWTDIIEVFAVIDAMPAVRCVVIASSGKHFTAGLDLGYAASSLQPGPGDPARQREAFRRKILRMQESFSVIDRCRVPVIAVIQGGCIGAGVDLVSACDIRIGTADCFFTIQEVNIAVVADVGTLQRLPHLLPQGLVRELAYTGRRMKADEAERRGLLNSLHADPQAAEQAALVLAQEIAAKSPMTITGIKQILNAGRNQGIEEGLDYVATWNAGMLLGADLQEAVTSLLHKRPAQFADLER